MNSSHGIYSIALLLFSYASNAQSLTNSIEEILVHASLVPISSERSANAITLIDYKQIENRSVSSISELLRNVPGLAVSKSGVQGSQTQIRVRGSEANHLLVLIDGIEANNPSQNDGLNWGIFAASDIERIEVVRGPQSSMLGSDAISGVINIITKNADKPRSLKIFSENGSFDTNNNGISFGLINDGFNARLGLSQLQTDGANISRAGKERDGYKNRNLTFKSGFNFNENLQAAFSLRRSDGMNEYDSDFDFDGLVDDQDKVTKFENAIMGFKFDYLNSDKTWQYHVAISESKSNNKDFQEALLGTSTSSTKDQLRFISSKYWDEFSQRISFLAEYEREKFSQRGRINDYGIYGVFNPNQDQNRNTNSIAIEYRADVFNKTTLAASTRRDDNSQFKDANTFKVELIYDLSVNARLRSSYGTAVKNPTFTERFGFYTNFIGNPFLQPEKSISWELGLDQKFYGGNFTLSATLFNSELDNEIDGNAIDPITFGFTAINKLGLSKRNGLELNSSIRPSKNITLNTSYTFTQSQELDAKGKYQNEVRRPRHIASLNMSWQQSDSLSISTNIQYNGSQEDIVYPTNIKLADYTIFNLSANLSVSKKLDTYLRLENLFDESYEEIFGYQPLGFGAHIGIRYRP
jgi:vitamin B12 transporter